jgi:peptidoglycan/xylan/chitin deacetylase (PgdA/CDA1 family)
VVSESYNSTIPSQVLARYTTSGGVVSYVSLASLASTNGSWQSFQQTITIPAGVVSMTLFHTIAAVGSLSIDNVSIVTPGAGGGQTIMNTAQVLELQTAGHEVGSHTKSHPDLTTLAAAGRQDEIAGSKQALIDMGVTLVNTLAYPLGAYNAAVKTTTQAAGYVGARGIERGYNLKNTDKYALKIQQVDRTTTVADVQTWIDQAAQNKTWLILMFHQIDSNAAADLGTTPALFTQMVDAATAANVDIVTTREGIVQMN